jgi:nucleolar complex protein 2
MGTKKSTRKFEKNHLKDTIERRKDFKKIKQRNQVKDKKKARNAKERAVEASNRDDDKVDGEVQSNDAQRGFDDMTVDEFFQGGFEIPEIQSKMKGKGKIEGSAVNGRKRKRPDDRLEESGDTEISPESGEEEHGSGDIWSDSDEELDGVGAHEEDLKALAGKDPEFYKFLQENDAELLEFGENGDTSKPTKSKKAQKPDKVKPSQKSADEEVEVEDSDGPEEDLVGATDDTEINPAMVTKWKTAMVDQFSLRSTKEVVIAFRASAHVDEDEGKAYKYSISSPEGVSSPAFRTT